MAQGKVTSGPSGRVEKYPEPRAQGPGPGPGGPGPGARARSPGPGGPGPGTRGPGPGAGARGPGAFLAGVLMRVSCQQDKRLGQPVRLCLLR